MRTLAVYRGFVIKGDFITCYVGRSRFYTVQQAKDAIDAHYAAQTA